MMRWLASIYWFWQPLSDAVIEADLLFIKCIKKLYTRIHDRTDFLCPKSKNLTFERFHGFWKHKGIYVHCIILRPTITSVSVAIQAIQLSVQDKSTSWAFMFQFLNLREVGYSYL